MDVVVYIMEYKGTLINSDLVLVPFENRYYEAYKDIYHDCFYEMREALGLEPYNACDSLEELQAKKDDIFLLIIGGEMVGSVAIYGNEIDDLIVSRKFQNQGYGKSLLNFAIGLLQKRNKNPIVLGVTEWNKKAIALYKNNGFTVKEIKTVAV